MSFASRLVLTLTIAGVACQASHSQVTTQPGTPSSATPAADLSNIAAPVGRARSIQIPSDEPPPIASLEAPPTFSVNWLDPERRIALHTPRDLRTQGQMFVRIVLFTETQNAPKTQVIAQPLLAAWFKENKARPETVTAGNNLRATDLVRFFNTLLIQGEAATQAETELLKGLLDAGIVQRSKLGYEAAMPERMLITVPQVSTVPGCLECTVSADTRDGILQHELAHARYFVDAVYRDFSLWFWAHGLAEPVRQAFKRMLEMRGYDPSNRELLSNEMQAFLMHTPNETLFSAKLIGLTNETLAKTRQDFTEGLAKLGLDPMHQVFIAKNR
jgi:hypothetical protein